MARQKRQQPKTKPKQGPAPLVERENGPKVVRCNYCGHEFEPRITRTHGDMVDIMCMGQCRRTISIRREDLLALRDGEVLR